LQFIPAQLKVLEYRQKEDSDSLIVCDPQTSDGLLVAVAPSARAKIEQAPKSQGITASPFGEMVAQPGGTDGNLLCLE